jgi:hypothetical protein
MPDKPKEDSSSQPEPGDSVGRLVESRLTEERLDDIWERLQGTGNRGGDQVQSYGVLRFMRDLWITLRVTGNLYKVAGGMTLVTAAIILLFAIGSAEITIHTPATWQSAAGKRMPETLHFRIAKTDAWLEGKSGRIIGKLRGGLRGAGTITTRDASFSGLMADGTPFAFTGSLVLTNAPGVVNIRGRSDFIGAALIGELKVGTNSPVPFAQPYLP